MSLTALIPILGPLLDKLIPDKEKATEAKLKLFELEQQGAFKELDMVKELSLAQASVAKTEAAHDSLFVAGGRPFLIWVGGVAMAWQYIMYPMLQSYLTATGNDVVLPALNSDNLFELVALLLGLGGMRSYEKLKRAA
jgi:hypothetical protein